MSILDTALSRLGLQRKSDRLPILSYDQAAMYQWAGNLVSAAQWSSLTPQTLADYYTYNPVVHACVRAYSDAFSQARIKAYKPDSDDEIPKHEAALLFRRPNKLMGESEFWRYVSTYVCYGGNAYGHLVGNLGGRIAEIWPYNVNQMVGVPSVREWVDHFAYNLGNGNWEDVPIEEVAHVKWDVDVNRPWTGLAPVTAAHKDVDTHNEFSRLRKVLLQNDAMPMTAIKLPADAAPLQPKQRQEMKDDFRQLHGGKNFGKMAILEGGADIVRMALNFDELQSADLMASLEGNICSSFGLHPVIPKVKLGLDKSTYSNFEEAVHDFTQSGLVPLWVNVASEFTNALQPYYGDNFELRFDLTQIKALQQDQNALEARVAASLTSGLRTLNETRVLIGEKPVPGGDVWYMPSHVSVQKEIIPPPPPKPATPPPAPPPQGQPGQPGMPPDMAVVVAGSTNANGATPGGPGKSLNGRH